MSSPLVSVIMPFKNEEAYILLAIESVLAQTYKNIEIICVDDHSIDSSRAICIRVRDPRVRVISNDTTVAGKASSRNLGIRIARGEFIAFHDADDVSETQRIGAQLELACSKGSAPRVVGCGVTMIGPERTTVIRPPSEHQNIVAGFERLRNRVTIVAGTILAATCIARSVEQREKFGRMEDWDWLLRVYESGHAQFANVQEPLYRYFIRPKGDLASEDWVDYNLFVRLCQEQRRAHNEEFASIEEFRKFLNGYRFAAVRWKILKGLIKFNRRRALHMLGVQRKRRQQRE